MKIHDVIGHVRPYGRHLFLAQNVPRRQFHEPATMRQTRQTRVDETLRRQAVQYHIDPCAVRGLKDFLPEFRLTAVEHMLYTERAEIRLFRRARRREHFRSRRLRPLDGRKPHATRACVNQYAVTGFQLREFVRQRD